MRWNRLRWGPFDALVAMPRGMIDAAEVIFLGFPHRGRLHRRGPDRGAPEGGGLAGGSPRGPDHPRYSHDRLLFLPPGAPWKTCRRRSSPLIPVLRIPTNRLGYCPVIAVAMSTGAAIVGSSFSPINPFQGGIAQKLAELPLLSGGVFRLVFLALALTLWIGFTMHMARSTAVEPEVINPNAPDEPLTGRDGLILVVVAATFAVMVWGILARGWGFNDMSGLFFGMGIVVGAVAGLGVSGTADAYVRGFRDMTLAALLIGFARAIYVVLDDGRIVDTIVHAMVTPLEGLPLWLPPSEWWALTSPSISPCPASAGKPF